MKLSKVRFPRSWRVRTSHKLKEYYESASEQGSLPPVDCDPSYDDRSPDPEFSTTAERLAFGQRSLDMDLVKFIL